MKILLKVFHEFDVLRVIIRVHEILTTLQIYFCKYLFSKNLIVYEYKFQCKKLIEHFLMLCQKTRCNFAEWNVVRDKLQEKMIRIAPLCSTMQQILKINNFYFSLNVIPSGIRNASLPYTFFHNRNLRDECPQ